VCEHIIANTYYLFLRIRFRDVLESWSDFKVTQGHSYWRHSINHIYFLISISLTMRLYRTDCEILSLISEKLKRVTRPWTHSHWRYSIMTGPALAMVNLHIKFEVSNFIRSEDKAGNPTFKKVTWRWPGPFTTLGSLANRKIIIPAIYLHLNSDLLLLHNWFSVLAAAWSFIQAAAELLFLSVNSDV